MKCFPGVIQPHYPFSNTENNYLKVSGGHALHFLDEGEGVPVIMVHGNPTWSFYYRNVVLALKDSFRCIVPDHIGCGLSDKPQRYSYCLKIHIENLKQLIDSLGLKEFHLIVHDWGGPIGIGVAMHFLDRVKRIVVLNTGAFLSKHIPFRINLCRIPVLGEVLMRQFNGFAWPATFMSVQKPLPKDLKEAYLAPYNSWNNRVAIARFVQDIPLSPPHSSSSVLESIDKNLHKLSDKEMLIGWGRKDFCFNDHFLNEWVHRFPSADKAIYESAGHYVLEDAKTEILPRIKNFLVSS